MRPSCFVLLALVATYGCKPTTVSPTASPRLLVLNTNQMPARDLIVAVVNPTGSEVEVFHPVLGRNCEVLTESGTALKSRFTRVNEPEIADPLDPTGNVSTIRPRALAVFRLEFGDSYRWDLLGEGRHQIRLAYNRHSGAKASWDMSAESTDTTARSNWFTVTVQSGRCVIVTTTDEQASWD